MQTKMATSSEMEKKSYQFFNYHTSPYFLGYNQGLKLV